MKCLICGKDSTFRLCVKCSANFPDDFSKERKPQELVTEFERNKKLKEIFSCDKKLGRMELDLLHGIFRIGNIYHSVTELENFTFHTDTPRFKGILWRRDVTEHIYFTYQLRNRIKNTLRIDVAVCPYRNDGRYVTVEPPLKLFGYQQQFNEMINTTKQRIIREMNDDMLI